MRSPLFLYLFALAFTSFARAQGDYARFVPEDPRRGDTLRIEYDAGAPDAALQGAVEIKAEVARFAMIGNDTTVSIDLSRDGTRWSGTVGRVGSDEIAFMAQFRSGDAMDINLRRGWSCTVRDSAGRALRYAHLALSQFYTGVRSSGGFNGIRSVRNEERRNFHIEQERSVNPSDSYPLILSWAYRLVKDSSDGMFAQICREADSLYNRRLEKGWSESELCDWLARHGEEEKARELQALNAWRFPAFIGLSDSLRASADPFYAAILESRRNPDTTQTIHISTSSCAAPRESFIAAYGLDSAARLLVTSNVNAPSEYTQIAAEYLRSHNPARGLEVALAGIDAIRRAKPASWLAGIADRTRTGGSPLASAAGIARWGSSPEEYLLLLSFRCLRELQRNEEAIASCRMMVDSTDANSCAFNTELSRLYYDARRYDDLAIHVRRCLDANRATDEMLTRWRMACAKQRTPISTVDSAIASACTRRQPELLMSLRGSMRKETPVDLMLQNSDGSWIPLRSLKGRVVVIGFWASWCGEAGTLLAALQAVCREYGNDPRIAVFVINTLENLDGKLMELALADARSRLTCSVPCYTDNAAGPACRLTTMPHIYFIAPDGFLRFTDGAYINAAQFERAVLKKIELCLAMK